MVSMKHVRIYIWQCLLTVAITADIDRIVIIPCSSLLTGNLDALSMSISYRSNVCFIGRSI